MSQNRFGVTRRSICSDSIVYVAVGLLLATAALAAMFGPALRAAVRDALLCRGRGVRRRGRREDHGNAFEETHILHMALVTEHR